MTVSDQENVNSIELAKENPSRHIARLDAMRAFAVFSVVLFHLNPDVIPWGYVGVDLFFSLSGFLMTWIYLQALAAGNSISAIEFIEKRFWRIFPPLVVTTMISLVVATLFLSPGHLLDTAWSGLAALVSISNWLFYGEAGYFDTQAIFKPLLHTWSLGVEEQFYALFAIALVFTRTVPLWIFMCIVLLLSSTLWAWVVLVNFGVGLPHIHDQPFSALFYLPQYRAFQFALGGLAAYGLHKRPDRLNYLLIWTGVVILVCGFWIASNKNAAHLSAAATAIGMVPLLMHFPLLDRVGNLVVVGYLAKISYQLYLVHWPIVVFWHYLQQAPLNWIDATLCGILSLVCGDVLYRLTNSLRIQ